MNPSESFRALKGDKVVAEADDLDRLAARLKKLNIDARCVRILSSRYLPAVARAGFRAGKARAPYENRSGCCGEFHFSRLQPLLLRVHDIQWVNGSFQLSHDL